MPNILTLTADDVDDLLNTGAYGAGAVIRVQSGSASTGPFTDVSGTGATPTIALVSGTRTYTGFDPAGTTSTWYQTRYENVGASRVSAWSTAFQPGPGATATGTYATLASIKTRLGITDAKDDPELQRFCNFTNGWIESKTGRVLAPFTLTAALYDGFDAIANGRLFPFSDGIRTISLLRIAITTGSTFVTVPATDYFLRPTVQERVPGWPATEIWMTDIPSASNTVPFFPRGYNNVEITGTGGWAAAPDEIVGIAEKIVIVAWQLKASGSGNMTGSGGFDLAIRTALDGSDWHTLERYTDKPIELI